VDQFNALHNEEIRGCTENERLDQIRSHVLSGREVDGSG
jgi:hypothetical protein